MLLKAQTDRCGSLSEKLSSTETQSEERLTTINTLTREVQHLRQEAQVVIAPNGLIYIFDLISTHHRGLLINDHILSLC